MPRTGGWRVSVLAFVIAAVIGPRHAPAQQVCRDFAYGNSGYAVGYSASFTSWPGCGWRAPLRGPRWWPGIGCSPCGFVRPGCGWPTVGPWYGGGGCGWGGWSGSSWYSSVQSVYLAAPAGGVFFSGGIVPYPVPYAVPWFGEASGPLPATIVEAPARQRVPPGGVARAVGPLPRDPLSLPRSEARSASTPSGRRRAAVLVADGDRDLGCARGDRRLLELAGEAYRRAAAAAVDDPDIHVRLAIVLDALGRPAEAETALRRAVVLDGRLGGDPADRRPGDAPPLAVRGATILRAIAAPDPVGREALDLLANRWAARFAGVALAAVDGEAEAR